MALTDRQPIVFLDKDGTLVENVPYNVEPALIRLMPGAGEATRMLRDAGYRICVVSNQSGVARRYFPESALFAVEERLSDLLSMEGVELHGFYYCPHLDPPATSSVPACQCRKPRDGMLRQAASDFGVDLPACWMIGDILDDVEAGRSAGARTILVDNGGETEWKMTAGRIPHFTASNLLQAAEMVVSASARSVSERAPISAGGGYRV